ncbi:Hypothetical protein PHPALM_19582 [Phytophthora palmivora]|uniref:Uncharacterized protein n=1 Tax=Phytophthora palmivora TaxID=4796 RepID=A0A2P4XH11_9STRA|nr:Hypothetical protein PHPALM_19582 [Phytophthora palmivora]
MKLITSVIEPSSGSTTVDYLMNPSKGIFAFLMEYLTIDLLAPYAD